MMSLPPSHSIDMDMDMYLEKGKVGLYNTELYYKSDLPW